MEKSDKLKRIRIEGFKSIRELDMEVRDLNILIGPNGAGKSNFIEVFKLLNEVLNETLQEYTARKGGVEKILYYGSNTTPALKVELDFQPMFYSFSLLPTSDGSFIFENEFYELEGMYEYSESMNDGGYESKLNENFYVTDPIRLILKDWRVYHFHNTSDGAGVKQISFSGVYYHLKEDASNLAEFLYYTKFRDEQDQTDCYNNIIKTIQLVLPFFKDFYFGGRGFNEAFLFEWHDIYSDGIFNATDLSDGSLRFICLVTLLLQNFPPDLIIIDEPEIGLHPVAIAVLADIIKEVFKRSQIIISTQSVALINEFDAEDIIVADRYSAESTFHRLDKEKLKDWLTKYPVGELWEKNIIGGRPTINIG